MPEHIEMLGLHKCHSLNSSSVSRNCFESRLVQVLIDRLILHNGLENELGVIVERIVHEDTAGKKRWKVLCKEAPVTLFGVLMPCDVKSVIISASSYFWNLPSESIVVVVAAAVHDIAWLPSTILFLMVPNMICSAFWKTLKQLNIGEVLSHFNLVRPILV